MANFSDLLPLLRPELRGCPDFSLEEHANRVVRDFCARTHVWGEWLQETLVEDQTVYTLSVPEAKEVVTVPFIWLDGRKLQGSSCDFPGPDNGNSSPINTDRSFAFYPADQIRLYFVPQEEKDFFVWAVLRPTKSAQEFPDFILEHYEDGLLAGVKARLMLQPGQNWTNPQLAEVQQRLYRQEVGKARLDVSKQYTAAPLRVQPNRFV